MKTLTVKKQLALAFGTLALLVLLTAFLSWRALASSNTRFSSYVGEHQHLVAMVAEVSTGVNERAIAARNLVLVTTDRERQLEYEAVMSGHEHMTKSLAELNEAILRDAYASERDRQYVAAINKVEAAYGPVALDIVQLAIDGKHEAAIKKMNSECRPLLASLLSIVGDYTRYNEEVAVTTIEKSQHSYMINQRVQIAVSVVALFSAVLLGWLIIRRLWSSLGAEPAELSDAVQRVAEGDLSEIPGAAEAPVGSVLASLVMMQQQLVTLIGQVRTSANSIAESSSQIAKGNEDLSVRTEDQASSLHQTTESMSELSATIQSNADNSSQANELALGASDVAVKGGQVVGQVIDTMKGINDSSKKISDIISVIDGIAFQTNLLALNAAVEAARAGEQGRGFAVVAGEVRTLAQRSTEAAKEIERLINDSVGRVEQGTALVDEAGITINEVVSSISRVTDIMGDISSASIEQSAGVSQVGSAISQMNRVTQQNATLVEEGANAADSLQHQAVQLVAAVSVFKLSQNDTQGGMSAPRSGATVTPLHPKVTYTQENETPTYRKAS